MKKIYLLFAIYFLVVHAHAQISIPALSPSASIKQQIGLGKVSINYARPSLRGRQLLGKANIPFGKVWRLGANEATTIEITDSMLINGRPLAKGKYALMAIPGESEWTIIINSNANQWGAYTYSEKKDIMRINVKAEKLKEKTETLSFYFEDVTPEKSTLVFKWENSSFQIGIEQKTDEKVMAEIKEKMAKEKISYSTYMEAAEYYLYANKDLNQALEWTKKLLEIVKTSGFCYNLQAQIAQKLNNCELAISAAKSSILITDKNGDEAANALSKSIIKNCEAKK
jgi:Protein of unknown function (DUF2911)